MDWFYPEGAYTILMIGVFVSLILGLKLPTAIAMLCAAIAGALAAGEGVALRHLVEGGFGYLDPVLVIATAMIFMKVLHKIGLMNSLSVLMIRKFRKYPAALSLWIMLAVMLPGMITGSSTTAVLTTGALVAPVLGALGLTSLETATVIALGAILGMVAPPVCLPAMIICGGTDIPYVGFTRPLVLCTFPLAIVYAMTLIYPKIRKASGDSAIMGRIMTAEGAAFSFRLVIPLVVLIILIIIESTTLSLWSGLGMPLIFSIASISAVLSGSNGKDVLESIMDAVDEALPIMGVLMAVGMFIQVMTLTGSQGFIVVSVLSLPSWMLYAGMVVSMPLFGAVSSFGSASVLGVPFLLALLQYNPVIVASALSIIISLGDLVPPAALAGRFASQLVGEKNYIKVFRKSIIPGLAMPVWGLIIILLSEIVDKILM